jgi:hypothetical protein
VFFSRNKTTHLANARKVHNSALDEPTINKTADTKNATKTQQQHTAQKRSKQTRQNDQTTKSKPKQKHKTKQQTKQTAKQTRINTQIQHETKTKQTLNQTFALHRARLVARRRVLVKCDGKPCDEDGVKEVKRANNQNKKKIQHRW